MRGRRTATTQADGLRRIYQEYLADGGETPVRLDELYNYAVRKRLPIPPPTDPRQQFRRLMSRALREDYFTDGRGRVVRRYHATLFTEVDADGDRVQKSEWDDIDTAPRKHMEGALQLRRRQIVGDCKQLKNDGEYYNDRHPDEPPIRTLFDFTDDVEEASLSNEYDPDGGS